MDQDFISHWDSFYAGEHVPLVPSQFGAFVAGEFPDSNLVVDFGCGNGRDTLLFAGQGKRVIAVDASHGAIRAARAALPEGAAERVTFVHGPITCKDTWQAIFSAVTQARPISPTLYARFFLHAIDDLAQTAFLDGSAELLRDHGGRMCLEFRTPRDAVVEKWAGDHYRRYVALADLTEQLEARGLDTSYSVEGFGLARFRSEDAHVARVICSPP